MEHEFLFAVFIAGAIYFYFRIRRLEREVRESKGEALEGAARKKEVYTAEKPPPPPQKPEDILGALSQETPAAEAEPLAADKAEASVPAETRSFDRELEFKFGSKIFTGIGAIAVIFGVGFFLKYAFENNLITEVMRVMLGIIAGVALLVVGEFTRRKYSVYGQIVTGGGLGVLYLSLYASFTLYSLVPYAAAFVGMIIVTALGVVFAIRYNSVSLAGFAQLGGFLTPLILSSGENHPHALFLYIALLDIGILAIARWKLWRILAFGSFLGTVLIYILWYARFYSESQFAIAEWYATLFFFIFLGLSLIQYFAQKASQDEWDFMLLSLNAGLYFLVSYTIINPLHHEWMGFFTAALAALYLVIAVFIRGAEDNAVRLRQFLAGIGLVFAVVAAPIQFEKFWITIAWATEAFVLTFLGFQIASKPLRIFAHAVFLLTFVRLFALDTFLSDVSTPWINARTLTFLVTLIFLSLATFLYWHKESEIDDEEKSVFTFLPIEAGLVFLWGGSVEIWNFLPHWWLPVYWSLGVLAVVSFSFLLKNTNLRVFGFLVLGITFIRLLAFDAELGLDARPWANTRLFVFLAVILSALVLLLIYYSLRAYTKVSEYKAASSVLLLEIYILTLWFLSLEVIDFHARFWLPICWAVGAFFGGWISITMRNAPLRLAAYLTFLFGAYHLLAFETTVNLATYSPLFNARVLSFLITIISAGALLALIRSAEDLPQYEKRLAQPAIFLGINFLSLWLLSVEVLDYFNQQFQELLPKGRNKELIRLENRRNASLSVAWTLYAIALLVLGIIRKSAPARLLAIFLFAIVIFKVFLYDTANLNNFYRFVSFITLGLILLLTGYLYHRYRERIAHFIKAGEEG